MYFPGRKSLYPLFILLLLPALGAWGGDLQPSTSPGGTMKTLAQVEPRTLIEDSDLPLTITAPGSYYLAENLTYDLSSGSAIVISVSHVTIDLNGFTLSGQGPTSSVDNNAICLPAAYSNKGVEHVTIRNGVITNFGGVAVALRDKVLVEDLIVTNIGTGGIHAFFDATVRRCLVSSLGYNNRTSSQKSSLQYLYYVNWFGISLHGGNITDCQVINAKFNVEEFCAIRGCGIIRNNRIADIYAAGGVTGISAYDQSTISNNSLSSLTSHSTTSGIYTYSACNVYRNIISELYAIQQSNTYLYGIQLGLGSMADSNTITELDCSGQVIEFISCSSNCRVTNNTLSDAYNNYGNVYGINLYNRTTISNNSITELEASSGYVYGIAAQWDHNRIDHNELSLFRGSGQYMVYGIDVRGSYTKVHNNTLSRLGTATKNYDINFGGSSYHCYYAANITNRVINDNNPFMNTNGTMPGPNVTY